MDFLDVYQRYKSDLKEVEHILAQTVDSKDVTLTQSSVHLLEAGGKRIRPLFALMCGRFGSGDKQRVYSLAAAMELLHMATLVHDDVIDDALLRRGRPTVKSQYGNLPAMYAGDFLFAKAILLLNEAATDTVHPRASRSIVKMCEGELDQIADFFNAGQSFRDYFRRIQRKTALLIELSCSLGATVTGASREVTRALGRFGRYTGMAFQIIDDILDFTGDEKLVGKRVGSDLRQGNLTYPTLYTLTCTDYGQVQTARIRPDMSDDDIDLVLAAVQKSHGIEMARETARRYMEKGLGAISGLEAHPAHAELVCAAEFINHRLY